MGCREEGQEGTRHRRNGFVIVLELVHMYNREEVSAE